MSAGFLQVRMFAYMVASKTRILPELREIRGDKRGNPCR